MWRLCISWQLPISAEACCKQRFIIHTYTHTHTHTHIHIHTHTKVKVKWSRYRPGVTQRVGRGIALLFQDRGTGKGWVVSSTPQPHFAPGKDPVPIVQEPGWAPGPVWTRGKSRPHGDSIPDRPARSQSLYRLSYPAHTNKHTNILSWSRWCFICVYYYYYYHHYHHQNGTNQIKITLAQFVLRKTNQETVLILSKDVRFQFSCWTGCTEISTTAPIHAIYVL